MALMTGERRTATVVAHTDVRCYRLGKEAFEAILRRRPELANEISRILAQRRVELDTVKDQISQEAFRDQMLNTQNLLYAEFVSFLAWQQIAPHKSHE